MNEIQAEKLDRFVNSVNNEVDEKINKIISEAEIQKSHQVKKTEDEELLNAYNKIQRSVRDIESKYRRMLALKQQQLKTDSLMQRENLAQKIFDFRIWPIFNVADIAICVGVGFIIWNLIQTEILKK